MTKSLHQEPSHPKRLVAVSEQRTNPAATRWMVSVVGLCLASLVGCSGSGEEQIDNTGATTQSLSAGMPQPTLLRVDIPQRTQEQQRRHDEVDRYLADEYERLGYRIVETTQTYSGDIVDWVDPATVPGSDEPPPPPIEWGEGEGPIGGMELTKYPELRGPAGTIPFSRPSYSAYVNADTSSGKFASIEKFIAGQVSGQPAGQFRLYGGWRMVDTIQATVANLSIWEEDDIENNTFSLLELNVVCDGPDDGDQDLVGATTSRDRANFGDPADAPNRVQVEIYHKTDDDVGEFSRWAQAPYVYFVPHGSAPYGPGAAYASVSSVGGSQYSYRYELKLDNGNWWINHDGNWLGYYPASLLPFFQDDQGCRTSWYGEVYDPSPTNWTNTNMGSGEFASEGWQQAAYIREPFYKDGSGVSRWAEGSGGAGIAVGPVDTNCYTTSAMLSGGTGWTRHFYLGGPGGDDEDCD